MPAAAKQDDTIYNANETHIVMVPSPSGQTPTPVPLHVFNAPIKEDVSSDVNIEGKPAAVVAAGPAQTSRSTRRGRSASPTRCYRPSRAGSRWAAGRFSSTACRLRVTATRPSPATTHRRRLPTGSRKSHGRR